jgi:hypothetical protein
MEHEKLLGQILRRLDILISLQLETSLGSDAVPISGKIQRLSALGLVASEIASIIGKPVNYVTAILSQKRKIKKKKEEKKDEQ